MNYPEGTLFTTVTGKFIRSVENTPDGTVPVTGTITFVPQPFIVKSTSAIISHFAAVQPKTTVTLVNGEINPPIELLASDNYNIEPRNWTYTVYLDFDHVDGIFTFSIPAIGGSTLLLDTVVPANPSMGIYIGADQVLALITGINEDARASAIDARLARAGAEQAAVQANNYVGDAEQVLDTLLEYLAGRGVRWFLDTDNVPAFALATDQLPPTGTPEILWDVDNDGTPAFTEPDTSGQTLT